MASTLQQANHEIWVKGDPKTSTLGDCPFCHRALLTLEEKKVPYTKGYISFDDKPDWLKDVSPEGSVPVLKTISSGQWTPDSAGIVDFLEETYPDPPLGKADSIPEVGSKVFPSFVQFLKSKGEESAEKEQALVKELEALDAHLAAGPGPFLQGADISAADLALGPKLYHLQIALKEYKNWELPAKLVAIRRYYGHITSRPSWTATHYSADLVKAGWKSKVEG